MFELIKNIDLLNLNWQNKIFITSDIDWASDEVLESTISLIEQFNAKCTFFATHETNLLENLSNSFEIGLHPNFNFLMNGDFRYGNNYKEVINFYKLMFPEAISFRSHSLTQNGGILDYFDYLKFNFEVNTFIPYQHKNLLIPYKSYLENLIRVPYIWEDDTACLYNFKYDVNGIFNYQGIKVLDFHPIHIFLNTENLERYNSARPYLQIYKELKQFINTSKYGTRDFLIDIMKGAL